MMLLPCSPRGELCHLRYTNVSKATLAWVETNRCKGANSQAAAMAHAILPLRGRMLITEGAHLAGILMGDIDGQSRDRLAPSLLPEREVKLSEAAGVKALMAMFEPVRGALRLEDHHVVLLRVHENVTGFLRERTQGGGWRDCSEGGVEGEGEG